MTKARRRGALAAIAVVLLASTLAIAQSAHGQEGAVEVRVAAQRLADGRTEFALQERQPNGSWGERRLPSGRFFPASTRVGRWLGSSPLTIEVASDSMSTAAGDTGIEVRVAAQLLSDGRMEFALQERESGGSWGERRLPRARFFPANATIGRWLSSSALTVSLSPGSMSGAAPTGACVLAHHVDRVTTATFQVQTSSGTGTAFYIGNGEWITNHHVVDTASRATLVNGSMRVEATVAGSLPNYDLALLNARPPSSVPALAFVRSRPALASDLMVVGFPAYVSGTPSVTRGVVSKHAPPSTFASYHDYFLSFADDALALQHSAPQNPGNSGGPIVDDCGAVVGVSAFGFEYTSHGRPVEGISFGIAAETVTAQLRNLRSSTHYVRRAVTPTAPASTTLEVAAFCNREANASFETCSVAGARGLHSGLVWIHVSGVRDYDNLYYSIDGGEAREYLTLRDLGRGRHTLQVNELRTTGWTGWSAPHTFTITQAGAMEIPAVCNGDWADYDTSEQCFAAGSRGILAENSPVVWTLGVADWNSVVYSLDGGPVATWDQFTLRGLAPGFHTIQVSEQQAAGWTGWSEPYAFTIVGAAPLEITAFCDGPEGGHTTSEECHAASVTRGGHHWIWPRGVVNSDNLLVSVNGRSGVAWDDLNLWSVGLGRHNIRIGEQQPAGWTGWSEPYWFTVRR